MRVREPGGSELAARVLSGDTEAFAELVRRHQRSVHAVVASLLRDRDATENLVQQTFINAFERLHQFRADGDLLVWLKGIARNLCYDELRRSTKEAARLGLYRDVLLAQMSDDGDHAAHDERERAIDDALEQCRRQLSPAALRALSLRYEDGLGVEAIARTLGRSANATHQLLFRARVTLRQCIDGRIAR